MVHFEKISAHVTEMRKAEVRGALFRLPSGMIVLSDVGDDEIDGQIASLRSPSILLSLLDEFHGVHRADPSSGLFYRNAVAGALEDGTEEMTNAYIINPARLPRSASAVVGADWRSSIERQPPLLAKLTERQKSYIRRLGSCSGREIVPIDLGLYRELLHLEVVVDKGRRLALSALGQELFRLLP